MNLPSMHARDDESHRQECMQNDIKDKSNFDGKNMQTYHNRFHLYQTSGSAITFSFCLEAIEKKKQSEKLSREQSAETHPTTTV